MSFPGVEYPPFGKDSDGLGTLLLCGGCGGWIWKRGGWIQCAGKVLNSHWTEQKPVVLVVDDERDHADGMVEALGKLSVEALAVYTGEHALEVLRHQRIDVVVTDLKLEGQVDGLDVLREARQQGDPPEVILITAYGTIENCKEAIRQGAFDYLVKPIDIDQLRTLVEQASRKATGGFSRAPTRTGSRNPFCSTASKASARRCRASSRWCGVWRRRISPC